MALEYYSFQNADDITQIFNAIAALTSSDDYRGLIKVVFLAGAEVKALSRMFWAKNPIVRKTLQDSLVRERNFSAAISQTSMTC